MDWRAPDSLPSHLGNEWSIWDGKRKKSTGLPSCKALAKSWDPIGGLLIGKPGNDYLQPPVGIPEIVELFRERFVRRLWFVGLFYGLVFGGLAGFWIISKMPVAGPLAAIAFLLLLVTINDARLFSQSKAWLLERATFVACLRNSKPVRRAVLVYLVALISAYVLQSVVNSKANDPDGALLAYGVFYKAIEEGQWWRLLSGPYVHANFSHLFANAALGALGVGVFCAVLRPIAATTSFVIGNIVAATAQWLLASFVDLGMTGVSGGVFSIYGSILGAAFLGRADLPRGFWVPMSAVLLMSIPLATIAGANVATFAHLGGFVSGLLLSPFLGGPVFKRTSVVARQE